MRAGRALGGRAQRGLAAHRVAGRAVRAVHDHRPRRGRVRRRRRPVARRSATPSRSPPGCSRSGSASASGGSTSTSSAGACRATTAAPLADWMMSHLPITLAIAAAGAAMVSLIGHAARREHAGEHGLAAVRRRRAGPARPDPHRAPLVDAERLAVVYRPLSVRLAGGAVAALVVGWLRPAPWLLALLLVAILVGRSGSSPSAGSCAPTPGARKGPARTDTLDRGVPDGVEYVIIVCRRAHPARHNPGLHMSRAVPVRPAGRGRADVMRRVLSGTCLLAAVAPRWSWPRPGRTRRCRCRRRRPLIRVADFVPGNVVTCAGAGSSRRRV